MPAVDDLDRAKPHRRRPRLGRVRTLALAIALILLAGLILLWTQRKPIATGYIDRTLAARGVPMRYRIATLGVDRQRLTDVAIGDPARPDLVADWVELRTAVGVTGATVTGIRAGHVRMRGRLVDGKLVLGAIDRLLPAPSGKPFALPAIHADIEDARMRLETPLGVAGLKLSGRGRLDDGFTGQLAVVSDRLAHGNCRAEQVGAALAIRIRAERPTIMGPARAARLTCAGAKVAGAGADISVALNAQLDRWEGKARLAAAAVDHPAGRLRKLGGALTFAGSARETNGAIDLQSRGFAGAGLAGATGSFGGRYRVAGSRMAVDGRIGAGGASLSAAALARAGSLGAAASGTPVGPLIRKFSDAALAAARSFDLDGQVTAIAEGGRGRVTVTRLGAAPASGAHLTFGEGAGIQYDWPAKRVRIDGALAMGGGGIVAARMRLVQARPGAPITGVASVEPYASGATRLALAPISFSAVPGGITRASTRLSLSGPLGEGRVEQLTMPLSLFWDGGSRFVLNPGCAPLAFDRLVIAGLALDAARTTLCPLQGGLVRYDGGRLRGGAHLAALKLAGKLGSTPLAVAAAGAEARLADSGFSLSNLAVRLGAADRVTRLDVAHLDGRLAGKMIEGGFRGGDGQIGKVPLLLSAAEGGWTLRGGRLAVTGRLMVADAAADPRFRPLAARGVALNLADNRITASGRFYQPAMNSPVADVAIVHNLSQGVGHADLAVPGLVFGKDFQPDQLTRLTFGVIADVVGTITGEGHIRWSPEDLTSDGVFRTAGTDLAAAFGPATGIAGEIRFTDLLAMESAPGQTVTIKALNPGVPVNDGTIRFQTLAGTRIRIEEGRWPFAGGSLVLEPTLLDFSEPRERRMTFRVGQMNAGQFLQQFDFKNLDATGEFDGVLPMIFDERGGRIENGRLSVRSGGGTIAYVGEVSQEDVGFWGNLAFDALKSLRYRSLDIVMNGPLAGEMITDVRFAGVGQGKGAKRNFVFDRLQKLPFIFNVRIKAPFRQLIDSAQSFYDPTRLIERNLPALLEEQNKRGNPPPPAPGPIQPPASRDMP